MPCKRRDLGSVHRAPEPWSSPSGTRSFGQFFGGWTNGEQNRARNEELVVLKGSPCYCAADAQQGHATMFPDVIKRQGGDVVVSAELLEDLEHGRGLTEAA